MGICLSSRSFAADKTTAKLIHQDGRLEEFPHPVKVSQVLQSSEPACFICSSDEMEFDGVVSAVGSDEELQPGQLYFALPLSKLDRPMQAQEMASLAVRASSALMRNAGRRGSRRKVVFPVEGEEHCSRDSSVGWDGGIRDGGGRDGGGGGGGGKEGRSRRRGRRKFTAELSEIPE